MCSAVLDAVNSLRRRENDRNIITCLEGDRAYGEPRWDRIWSLWLDWVEDKIE